MISDSTTLTTLRNFLASTKPPSLNPIDILVMAHLISRKAEDHPIFDSQQTLARMFNTDTRTIARAQKKLASKEIDWISKPQRRGKTNLVSIKYQNVPCEEILRLEVTPQAKAIAAFYQMVLKNKGRKKFPAQWLDQQHLSAQRILTHCKGDGERAGRMILHALEEPAHTKTAQKSLYNLFGRWKRVESTYTAQSVAVGTEAA